MLNIEFVSTFVLFCARRQDMYSLVTINLHHHEHFGLCCQREVITEVDTYIFTFRDLDDFAIKYAYNFTDLVQFKNDGVTFESGMRFLFDDKTVREMVDIHKPNGEIDLYVDHYDLDKVIDASERLGVQRNENTDNIKGG